MFLQEKRTPTYEGHEKMPFGKYKGQPLDDVPASYLLWMWNNIGNLEPKLKNYIWNSKTDIEQETGEEIG